MRGDVSANYFEFLFWLLQRAYFDFHSLGAWRRRRDYGSFYIQGQLQRRSRISRAKATMLPLDTTCIY